ncbi:TPA: hypothetical protein QEL16_003396 [Stenotrophomonas maltophilia]|nr:hypothetical protein [Stenotrophomonas maltophilia]HDS1642703.1 hypothetical protein [Stenotrophomonas maltophilia]
MHDADKEEDAQSQADSKSSPIPPFGDSSQGHLVTILAGALGSGVWAIGSEAARVLLTAVAQFECHQGDSWHLDRSLVSGDTVESLVRTGKSRAIDVARACALGAELLWHADAFERHAAFVRAREVELIRILLDFLESNGEGDQVRALHESLLESFAAAFKAELNASLPLKEYLKSLPRRI